MSKTHFGGVGPSVNLYLNQKQKLSFRQVQPHNGVAFVNGKFYFVFRPESVEKWPRSEIFDYESASEWSVTRLEG